MKSDILKSEIALINNKEVKEFVIATLENVPEYFYTGMASSTGKYHPICTCKKGGLIVHVKRVVYLANRLCTGLDIKNIDRDIILAACILHDIAKVPSPKIDPTITYADYENHPLNAQKHYKYPELFDVVLQMYIDKIHACIIYHMGLWTPQSIKKPIEKYTKLELIVYTADYIATTKDLVTPRDTE